MCICPTEKVNDYFENDFLKYQEELAYLFEVYTEEEIETLFVLLSKLYAGIENPEKRIPVSMSGRQSGNRTVSQPEFKRMWIRKSRCFLLPGGFNYEKMSLPSKLMMKMFVKMLKAKKDKTEVEREMVKMISSSYDISDKKYIEPVLECLKK